MDLPDGSDSRSCRGLRHSRRYQGLKRTGRSLRYSTGRTDLPDNSGSRSGSQNGSSSKTYSGNNSKNCSGNGSRSYRGLSLSRNRHGLNLTGRSLRYLTGRTDLPDSNGSRSGS